MFRKLFKHRARPETWRERYERLTEEQDRQMAEWLNNTAPLTEKERHAFYKERDKLLAVTAVAATLLIAGVAHATSGDRSGATGAGGYGGGSGSPLNDDVKDYSALQGGSNGGFTDGGDSVGGNDACGCTSGEAF
jgi:hypothetical protein